MKELLLEISYKCNLHCIHCSSIGINPEYQIKIQDIPNLVNLDEIDIVRLSGGEPSLLYDLDSYIKFFKNHDIKVVLQTNGYNELSKTTLRLVDEIWVSLYGNKYIHDFITQKRGVYNKVNQNLEFYSNYISEFSNTKIVIQSPIFNEKQLISLFCQMNTGLWNKNFNIELRLFALLNQGRCNYALSIGEQLKIINSLQYKYHVLNITCSLDPTKCNYENKLVLKPDGSLFNCASHKHGKTLCKK